jgi:iron complex outermembrane receptor protein
VPLLASAFGRTYSSASVPVDSQTDKFTQEVRLSSNGKQAIEWLAGLFYTNEDSSLEQFFALRDLAGQPAPNDLFTFFVPSRYEEYAGFGDLTWHLSDRFDVTGGVRYAKNRQRFSQTGSGVLGLSAPTNRASSDVFTYLANARYHFSERQTAYVRYATGYRPGGPAYVTIDTGTGLPNGPATFEADRLKSYEIGFKSETQDRRFGIEAAGYVIDWTDMQVAFNNNGFSSVHNAPGADIQGVELTFTARPVRAFSFTGALAWQDAKVSEADLQLGAHEDEKLPNVPRISGTLSADYDLPMGLPVETWAPTIGATVRYVDDRKAGFGNTAYQLPGYTTVDLRTGATVGPVNLQLYVHNLFDEYGQLSVAYPQFGGRVAVLQPRTIGLTATMSF